MNGTYVEFNSIITEELLSRCLVGNKAFGACFNH